MVTEQAAALLAPGGRPAFAHLGRKFAEVRRRTDPAFDRAWAAHCAGATATPPAVMTGSS